MGSLMVVMLACAVCQPAPGLPQGWFSVKDCGAVGDGAADDTAAFQRAANRAAEVGGVVVVEPVRAGGGYVLTRMVVLPPGVSVVGAPAGMPFFAWEGVARELQPGPVVLARPDRSEYEGLPRKPLFRLSGGNTIRGLYILYDRQPWPSDAEFADPNSPYYYPTLADLLDAFIRQHSVPYGPTITVSPGTASCTVEDVTCARYNDFLYAPSGGKLVVHRCYLYGLGRAFAIRRGPDTIRISEIHVVPNVEGAISWQHAKLQAAITARPANTVFDLAGADGYSVTDVTIFLAHTGFRLGASESRPFFDPETGETLATPWGQGPWGSCENVKIDNCAVGFDCLTATILPNQLANIMVHLGVAPRESMETEQGRVGRQAAFVLEPGFAGGTLQVSDLSLSTFAPANVLATAAMAQQAGGRAFLFDCPASLGPVDYADRERASVEISGLVVSNIPLDHRIAWTAGTRPHLRARGYVHNGIPQPDWDVAVAVQNP